VVGAGGFVVDTSRNGLGSNGEWCNPTGRALGRPATGDTGAANVHAYLYVKRPGESDGTCNGGPAAGAWWAEYALGLAQRASST
jgi:endoglucanase